MSTGLAERDLVKDTTMAVTDFVRIVKDDDSRLMNLTNFATSMQTPLEDAGFLTDDTVSAGVVNKHPLISISSNHTLVLTNDVILVDVTSGDITVDLVAAATAFDSTNAKGQQFTIKLATASGTNKVILDASGAETIDGNGVHNLTGPSLVFATIISDGSNWQIIGS